jgi:hypothetical protein
MKEGRGCPAGLGGSVEEAIRIKGKLGKREVSLCISEE